MYEKVTLLEGLWSGRNPYVDHVTSVWRNEHCWHDSMFIPLVNQKPWGTHSSLARDMQATNCSGRIWILNGVLEVGRVLQNQVH